jgi:hypothetical protein
MTEHTPAAAAAIPLHSNPSWLFLEALPDLARIDDELAAALQSAMTQGHDHDRGFAEAAWMLSKALGFLVTVARSDDPAAFDAALVEVDTDALAVAGRVRAACSRRGAARAPRRHRRGLALGRAGPGRVRGRGRHRPRCCPTARPARPGMRSRRRFAATAG